MKRIVFTFIASLVAVTISIGNSGKTNNENEEVLVTRPPDIIFDRCVESTPTPSPTPSPTPNPYEVATSNMQRDMEEISYIEDEMEWFIAYKDIVFDYAKWITPPKTVFDEFTEEEVRLICRAVETETYDQDFISKTHVASVIFNRLKEGREYGDSITEVITKENQFAYWRTILTEDTILAVMYTYELGDTTNGCVAFRSKQHPEKWYDWKLQFVDEAGHGLYK